jgi:hypothetical protein
VDRVDAYMRRSAAGGWRVIPGAPQGRNGGGRVAGGSAPSGVRLAYAALLVALGFLLGAVGTAVPAGATEVPGAYPPPAVGLQLSTSQDCPPAQITVTGQGFASGQDVTLTLMSAPVPLGTAAANRAGDFSHLVTVPSGAPLGSHQVVATGRSFADPAQPLSLSAQLTLACAATVTVAPSHVLPFTGFATRAWLVASLAFILAGAALVLRAHKRRQHRAL